MYLTRYNKKIENNDTLKEYIKLANYSDDNIDDCFIDKYATAIKNKNEEILISEFNLSSEQAKEIINLYEKANSHKEEFKSEDVGYFRKHSDLHSYIESLYYEDGGNEEFNCVPFILDEDKIEFIIKQALSDLDIYRELQSYCKNHGIENDYELNSTEFLIDNASNKLDELERKGKVLFFSQGRGFFWGESQVSDWAKTVEVFTEILYSTDFDKQTIAYNSWW